MVRRLTLFLIIIATALTPVASRADVTAVADSCFALPDIRVSLLTCGPGSDVYELEGHTGLRIVTPEMDVVANWGMFDFNAPNFVGRFVMGQTDYSLGIIPTQLFLDAYTMQRRYVEEQDLDLSSAQASRLLDMVMENYRPENRVYRYNYIHDNCATRPLEMIERAAGSDKLTLGAPGADAECNTFRRSMTRFHSAYPWYQFGIDLALGTGIDSELSPREHTFAPVTLHAMLGDATLTAPDGSQRALVSAKRTLVEQAEGGGPSAPTPWFLTPMAVFTLLLAATVWLSVRDIRRRSLTRWFDTAFYTALGLTGCLSAFLVFISVHAATSPNWILLWINPLCLIVPACIWSRRTFRAATLFQYANLAGIVAFACIWASDIQQGNPAFLPLMAADALRAITCIYISHVRQK